MRLHLVFTAILGAASFTSCSPKAEIDDSRNTVKITTRPITAKGEEFTEITIEQKLSIKSPLVVESIRDGIADSMRFSVNSIADHADSKGRHIGRTMIILAKPIKPDQTIVLLQRDFIFSPTVYGWPRLDITSDPTKSP